jgi:hypothetical protein
MFSNFEMKLTLAQEKIEREAKKGSSPYYTMITRKNQEEKKNKIK